MALALDLLLSHDKLVPNYERIIRTKEFHVMEENKKN